MDRSDATRAAPHKTTSFLTLPPDIHHLLISCYLDEYTILSLRHVNHYFYSFQLPSSLSPPRSYAACVAFHLMWENELLARHGSACEEAAEQSRPLEPAATHRETLLKKERQDKRPGQHSYWRLPATSNQMARSAQPLYLPCYECTLWLPISSFAHSQRTAKRALAHPQACKRYCIACGIKYSLRPRGLAIKVAGLQPGVVQGAKQLAKAPARGFDTTSTSSLAKPFLLPPLYSQDRTSKQTLICSKCKRSFRSLWYCCVGCFNVIAHNAAQLSHTNPPVDSKSSHLSLWTWRVRDGLWKWRIKYRTRQQACATFWDKKLGYLPLLLQQGHLGPTTSQDSRNYTTGLERADVVDEDDNEDRRQSEVMIGREARCADCWRPPAFPVDMDVEGLKRDTSSALQSFGMREIPPSHFCLRCVTAADARAPRSRLKESRDAWAV